MDQRITRKRLVDWAGEHVVREAEALVDSGLVLEAEFEPPHVRGAILWNNRALKTGLTLLSSGMVENVCPCYANKERGIICAHSISLGVVLVRRASDPWREAKYQEERRRAIRMETVDESVYVQRAPEGTPGSLPAKLRITLGEGWLEGFRAGQVPISGEAEFRGEVMPLDRIPENVTLGLTRHDENLLFVLEDISGGPAAGHMELSRADFLNIVSLLAGRTLHRWDGSSMTVNDVPLTTLLSMDLDRENGELIVIAHTELPISRPGEFPVHLACGKTCWVYGADNLWRVDNVLPEPYHGIYEEPVIVRREDVLRFLNKELPVLAKTARVETDISLDLFTVDPADPGFVLDVRGSPASLAATLFAVYGDTQLVAGKPDARGHFAVPDPSDLMRYLVRNAEKERNALALVGALGLRGHAGDNLTSIVGTREVLNFLGTGMPSLRRRGWKVQLEGRVSPYMDTLEFANPVVRISEPGGGNWFDVGFDFEDGQGASVSHADIQLALRKGEHFVQRNGRTILIDADAVESMEAVFHDCATTDGDERGHFRMSNVYASFIKSSLDALDGADVEAEASWRVRAAQGNRTAAMEPVALPPHLASVLRGYQKEGINWLRFLEANGFCGLLADEMGLGKTVQALAWLQLSRMDESVQGRASLIVCPTSLVENWEEEAHRYVPDMRVLLATGPDRHSRWDQIEKVDMVVTSYALLRRDLERYLEYEFAAVVLDEAQHIKNRSTQNALSAKQIRARHKLVLTGTPVENGVSDIWSIMDFVMPGYLGRHESFRTLYELPISHGGVEAEMAQLRLRRKLQPFLLRRLKTEVARDLPPKIQRVSSCALSPDQKRVYLEVLESSRRKISGMVSKVGFNKCRMEILVTLMRLRQICCHLDLLKLPGLDPKVPSAKMDLFFELLDEAIDGGHRVLVFSQFVSMLQILSRELQSRDLTYCYLDGSTKERLKVVHEFNTRRDIPLFLISLKAGGTGLNLTGADMVIHFDPWWNPAVEDQATDRAYRIGQKRTVYSVKLITKGTVEEKVMALQERKKAIINATVESDESIMQAMSWDDIQNILDL